MSFSKPQILDVRIPDDVYRIEGEGDLRDQIIAGLSKPLNAKSLPTLLLYDERGLRLYDTITTDCSEYYLFPAEEEILKANANEIVELMHGSHGDGPHTDGEVVLELGAGSLRKTSHILLSLARSVATTTEEGCEAPIIYYALDLEKSELDRTLSLVKAQLGDQLNGKVDVKGMWGTYDGGLKYIASGGLDHLTKEQQRAVSTGGQVSIHQTRIGRDSSPHSSASDSGLTDSTRDTSLTPPSTPGPDSKALHILFLGSTIGNFSRTAAIDFLKSLPLRPGSGDTLLLGLDHDNKKEQIELAYHDTKGLTEAFIMNGLKVAGRTFGDENAFSADNWEYVSWYDEVERSHEAYYKSRVNQDIHISSPQSDFKFKVGELVNIEVSLKYSDNDAYRLFAFAGLRPVKRWMDSAKQYSLWLLERPTVSFPPLGLSEKVLHTDNNDSKATATPFGVPTLDEFQNMWKAWDLITIGMIPREMLFVKPIDLRHICLFYLGHIPTFLDIHLSRLLKKPHTEPDEYKYIFERGIDPHVDDPTQCHPHSEVPQKDEDWPTLGAILDFRDRVRSRVAKLYEDISSGKIPLTRKIGRVLFMTLEHEGFHAETLLYMLLQRAGVPGGTLPPTVVAPKWDILKKEWDNLSIPEKPSVKLGPAKVTLGHDDFEEEDNDPEKTAEVFGHEFGWDNEHPKREVEVGEFRIEWRPVSNGQFYEFWKGDGKGRIMLPASWIEVDGEVQVRTLYGPISMTLAYDWPVIASYDDLSTYAQVKGGRIPTEPELRLFFDKFECGFEGGANIGFRNWHPLPATTGGAKDGGRGHNGGVWEWTSTTFDNYEGFIPSIIYPGYSSDFFDGKHQVVIGGSYATIPRLAERKTLRNFYQHNYPYAWCGARVAYDL